ncbi:MAG: DUF4760 domain-containing protein [Planctomycetota bacterium]
MSKEAADYHDAELVLKLYELRREEVMRASRDTMMGKFWPKSWEEFLAVTRPDHPQNEAYRQVASYWEMAYGMGRHGIVNAEYLVENGGEGLFLFAKVQPYVSRYREEVAPHAFKNAEWAATQTAAGRRYLEFFQGRIKALAAKS